MDAQKESLDFCGRQFAEKEVGIIREVVTSCSGLSRMELANTVCELLEWKRINGNLKGRECMDLLERLESRGLFKLPDKRQTVRKKGKRPATALMEDVPSIEFTGSVESFAPVEVLRVQSQEQRLLFRELVSRYHYLGYAMPYGARLQYLAYVSRPRREVVGCVQFSSPAWRMKVRDEWIGWDDATRKQRLQQVVNNSRLLIIPRIRNLASTLLACVIRRLSCDWQEQYGLEPWLVETLVDSRRFHGGCYRAANWIELGQTTGRGRMDRAHQRHGAHVKTVLVYPLVKNAAQRLRGQGR